jgi:hypothetical protein
MTLPTDGVFVVDSFEVHAIHAVSLNPDGMANELAVLLQVTGHLNHGNDTETRGLLLQPQDATVLTGRLLGALDTVRKHTPTTPE